MLPRLTLDNILNRTLIDTVVSGELPDRDGTRLVCGSDGANGFGSKFGLMRRFTDAWNDLYSAAFGIPISRVIQRRSEKQMIRANTGRIVAMVAHGQSLGNRTKVEFPREPMGQRAIRGFTFAVRHGEDTVGTRLYSESSASPDPAVTGLVNSLPELAENPVRITPPRPPARQATSRSLSATNMTRYRHERLTADATENFDTLVGILMGHGSHNLSCRAGDAASIARRLRAFRLVDANSTISNQFVCVA